MKKTFSGWRLALGAVVLAASLGHVAPLYAQQGSVGAPSIETLHNELRALRDRAVKAVNDRDQAALMKELNPDILFTAMNNERVHGAPEAAAYFDKMLKGPGRLIDSMALTAEADDLTTLYQNGSVGIATGTSSASFKMMSGLNFVVPLRWTATLFRADGRWTLAAIHFSADMFDNPLLSSAGAFWRWIAIVGVPLGLILGFWFGRRGRRKA